MPPGPGGCSVDIINREFGSYTGGRVQFTYDLAGPSCRDGIYGLVVTNTFNHWQTTLFAQRGSGLDTKIAFDAPLPFLPTADPTAGSTTAAGSGLCVIGFTIRQARITDVAPDQAPDLKTVLTSPNCAPLFLSGPPVGGARAFH